MAEFIPYEPKLEKISKSYYIEVTIMYKKFYVISYTEDLDDNVISIYPKSIYTLEESVEDFEDMLFQIERSDNMYGYSVVDLRKKQDFLNEHYPFQNTPDLLSKITCIHCDKEHTVLHYRTDSENRILCPDPNCDGTVADWIK